MLQFAVRTVMLYIGMYVVAVVDLVISTTVGIVVIFVDVVDIYIAVGMHVVVALIIDIFVIFDGVASCVVVHVDIVNGWFRCMLYLLSSCDHV